MAGIIDWMPVVSCKTLQKNIREYVERMAKRHKTKSGYTGDDRIDCPACSMHRGLLYRGTEYRGSVTYWLCIDSSRCDYRIPDEFAPPSPKELEELFGTLAKEKRRLDIMQFLVRVGFIVES